MNKKFTISMLNNSLIKPIQIGKKSICDSKILYFRYLPFDTFVCDLLPEIFLFPFQSNR